MFRHLNVSSSGIYSVITKLHASHYFYIKLNIKYIVYLLVICCKYTLFTEFMSENRKYYSYRYKVLH